MLSCHYYDYFLRPITCYYDYFLRPITSYYDWFFLIISIFSLYFEPYLLGLYVVTIGMNDLTHEPPNCRLSPGSLLSFPLNYFVYMYFALSNFTFFYSESAGNVDAYIIYSVCMQTLIMTARKRQLSWSPVLLQAQEVGRN